MKKIKIFAFPYAIGGASAYKDLSNKLSEKGYELCAVNYSGHETRFDEKLIDSIQDIAQDMYNQISKYLDDDYCLLGYSMGGTVCYELFQIIKKNRRKNPMHIFLIAADHPGEEPDYYDCKNMTIKRVKDIFEEMGGTPKEIMENEEMLEIMLPVVRNDLCATENYIPTSGYKIDCKVTLIRGTKEYNDNCEKGWNKFLINPCNYYEIEGEHFFLFDDDPKGLNSVVKIITDTLNCYIKN